MAEVLASIFASNVFDAYSAGTEIKDQINQDAVRIIKDLYGVNMEKTQYPKLLTDIPEVDIVIKMGCNVVCPYLFSKYEEDWGLEDPTGKDDKEFIDIARTIEK